VGLNSHSGEGHLNPIPLKTPRIICISGDAASGKTTAARSVLARLDGWRVVSTGSRFREYCARRGIDPQQISNLDESFHREMDQEMRRLLQTEERIIAEARLVGYLARDIDDSLRVFCDCPLEVRAERYRARETVFSPEEARARVEARDRADTENFRRFYGIDYHDAAYYHLILDTHELDPDAVAERILVAADGRRNLNPTTGSQL